jgi:hypothetical protein
MLLPEDGLGSVAQQQLSWTGAVALSGIFHINVAWAVLFLAAASLAAF